MIVWVESLTQPGAMDRVEITEAVSDTWNIPAPKVSSVDFSQLSKFDYDDQSQVTVVLGDASK